MKKVLVVDDNREACAHLTDILTRHGYQVMLASNGKEAIDLASEFSPDFVLMDIVMPELNGFQATRQLNNSPATSSIPVIMVSAKDQEVDKQWSAKQGAKAYLCKPVTEKVLMQTISQVVQ